MCVVSMVYDHYSDKWKKYLENTPIVQPAIYPPYSPITQEEINDFRKLLDRAKEYDKKNNQEDCELDQKKETLKKLAEQLGVDISFA